MHPDDAPTPDLTWLDSAGSTQDELLARLDREGHRHGAAVATADQRAGRGRHSRVWSAAPGAALALSVYLRPESGGVPVSPAHLSWLSLVASATVAERLAARGVPTHVKWPNDVLATDGRKLCGVLATVALSSDGKGPGVVVGMGVNLDHRGAAPVDTATDLAEWIGADAVPAPRDLAVELRDAVVAAVDRFAAGVAGQAAAVDGRHPAVAAVADRLSTLGRAVRAELPGGGVLEGTAVGLGPGGTLRVKHVTPDRGTIETEVSAGDVAHLRGDVHRGA
ncbi:MULTISPECIES: biotin--[acetyl-CoA-carboxylase] ligase [Micrococcus]|uniref:biotin--[acetyl-CoA-carboxylase] ligase n=1 Tax=Micrococcus TaxID=1269 RepID=UPI000C9B988C|nr:MULTISPECIES: biotin--[acetyl-CoA-carboxylase] ligase [Micrococcus]MCD0179346.1 biotin--[acetyl-CoA-carboxylase] ligase [Micrococcus luteus]MCK1811173.1 biotin--[acetyl-CoA-carboxylase] ligase [Micrococcus sp. XM4230A]MCT1868064.1 biotin--[acetyl-CoA-carboxylase] ligase [Micrococcus luteus]MCT2253181.1 biotin--[acetyl-CoA-carboxylase] ligase [Micrococcus luteus]MCT2324444.1 biotin--[acetyl-CoA-carboxylase] ligase [Micrococcus luteus]